MRAVEFEEIAESARLVAIPAPHELSSGQFPPPSTSMIVGGRVRYNLDSLLIIFVRNIHIAVFHESHGWTPTVYESTSH